MRKTYKKLEKTGSFELTLRREYSNNRPCLYSDPEEGQIQTWWVTFYPRRYPPWNVPGLRRIDTEGLYMLEVPLLLVEKLCGNQWELDTVRTSTEILEIYLPGWKVIDPLNQPHEQQESQT